MLAGERRIEILSLLRDEKFLSVSHLSKLFSTHETTIRRDLEILEKEGKVSRLHGGVAPVVLKDSESLFETRQTESIDEKIRIGQVAASFIRDGDSIILDSGTTTLQIALAIRICEGFTKLTIVTNDIKIASVLNGTKGVTVIVTGGTLYQNSFMLNGQIANHTLGNLNIDKVFLATPALDLKTGLNHFDEELAATKIYMSTSAITKIVVTDSTKIGKKALHKFLSLKQIDLLITDNRLSPEIEEGLLLEGIKKIERV